MGKLTLTVDTKRWKTYFLVVAFSVLLLSAGWNLHSILASSSDPIITPNSWVETTSYVVWKDGTTYYAKNGTTGAIDYSSTNASYVILSALNALPQPAADAGGGTVFLAEAQYEIDTQITIPWHRISLIGAGIESTILDTTASITGSVITFAEYTYGTFWNRIEDLAIDGYSSNTITGIDMNGVSSSTIRNVRVRGFNGAGGIGIHLRTSDTYNLGCYYDNIYNTYVSWCTTGIKLEGDSPTGIAINNNNIHGGWVQHAYDSAVNFTNAKSNTIYGLNVENYEGTQGYWFGANATQNNIFGGHVEDTGAVTGFNFTSATSNVGNLAYNVRFYLPSGTEWSDSTTNKANTYIFSDDIQGDFRIVPSYIAFDSGGEGSTWTFVNSWYGALNTAIVRVDHIYFVPMYEPDTTGWGNTQRGWMWFCLNHTRMEHWNGTAIVPWE